MSGISRILINLYFFVFFWFWWIVVWIITLLFKFLFFKQIKKIIKKFFFAKRKKSIFYFEVFAPESAGNKYRTQKWIEILNRNNFKAKSAYVFEYREYLQLTSEKSSMPFFHMGFMWFRFWQILRSAFYDIVVVRRELLMFNDYGNLFFEKFLSSIHSNRILDFDDDIAAAKREPRTISTYGKLLLEHPKKFSDSLKNYTHFFPGTNYLKELLTKGNSLALEENILVLPTCVDYDMLAKKNYNLLKDEITIGWVGARNNLHNLQIVVKALNMLSSKYKFRLLIVSDAPFIAPLNFPIDFIRWSEKFEIENILKMDVGIMPLENTLEHKGKCGFKLIQYMACGVVSIATALTVNNEIISDNINGFLVPPDSDWTTYFEKAFQMRNNFDEIGNKAKEKIKIEYTFKANSKKLITLLNKIDHKKCVE